MGRVLVWHADNDQCLEFPALKAAVKTAQQIIEIKQTPDDHMGQYPTTQGMRHSLCYLAWCEINSGCRRIPRSWKEHRRYQQHHILSGR